MTTAWEHRGSYGRLPAPFPPPFASAWGEDRFGLWADIWLTSGMRKATVAQRLRWIEPGEFMMGSPLRDSAREQQETPRHRVKLSEGFWLADTACTQAFWTAVMGSNPSGFSGNGSLPVENVSWNDVVTFLEALAKQLAGCEATLPTDAQWEYACRCGKDAPFSYGNAITRAEVNFASQSTKPVRTHPPNDWGLYEMHGNVCEWCADGLRQYSIEETVDPIGAVHDRLRVVRGGSWFHDKTKARSAYRRDSYPEFAENFLGFRICFTQGANQRLHESPRIEVSTSKFSPATFSLNLEQLAGDDLMMLRNVRAARRIASSRIPVLIQGPVGCGKEGFARAIHGASDRAPRSFVAVNCAAIPAELLESELLGTHAGFNLSHKWGAILRSSGGTLFLDEIAELPLHVQTGLLRVLEEQGVILPGTAHSRKVDLRVISSSTRDLRAMISRGEFREDLFYRLNGFTIELPPFAMRTDKERLIRETFAAESADGAPVAIEAAALQRMLAYDWPRNVRELRAVVRTALAIYEGDVVRLIDLPTEIRYAGLPGGKG